MDTLLLDRTQTNRLDIILVFGIVLVCWHSDYSWDYVEEVMKMFKKEHEPKIFANLHGRLEMCPRELNIQRITTRIIEKIKMIYWISPSRSPENIHAHMVK